MEKDDRKSFLAGEEFPAKVSIPDWLLEKVANDPEPELVRLLLNRGKFFEKSWNQYPRGLFPAKKTEALACHRNTIQYMFDIVCEKKSRVREIVTFVTGMYALRATSDSVPPEKRYVISPHTFLMYRGRILDCTLMNHPANCYVPDQYFGLEYSLDSTIITIEGLIEELPADFATDPVYTRERLHPLRVFQYSTLREDILSVRFADLR